MQPDPVQDALGVCLPGVLAPDSFQEETTSFPRWSLQWGGVGCNPEGGYRYSLRDTELWVSMARSFY